MADFKDDLFVQVQMVLSRFVSVCLFILGSPREYLEVFVFPTLLPGMESLLQQAEREKCFQVRSLMGSL